VGPIEPATKRGQSRRRELVARRAREPRRTGVDRVDLVAEPDLVEQSSRRRFDVAARQAAQLARAGDDDAVRIAEEQVGAHPAHLLEREQPQLVQPVVHQRCGRRPASRAP